MRQGLIAQWHRGIAARGLVGAMLLMIPVLVGATIGFGGVSAGLTSLASGPSATAVGTTGSKTAGDQPGGQDIERLSASLTTTLAQQRVTLKHPGGTGGPKSSSSAPGTTAVGGGTESDSSSDSSSGGGGSPRGLGQRRRQHGDPAQLRHRLLAPGHLWGDQHRQRHPEQPAQPAEVARGPSPADC